MRQVIATPKAPQPVGTYSQAIVVGESVYIAGQIALVPESLEMNNASIEEEVRQVFKNLGAVASAAGGNLNAICNLTVYVTNIEYVTAVNEVMAVCMNEPYPARAVVQVSALPRNARVEISAVMYLV